MPSSDWTAIQQLHQTLEALKPFRNDYLEAINRIQQAFNLFRDFPTIGTGKIHQVDKFSKAISELGSDMGQLGKDHLEAVDRFLRATGSFRDFSAMGKEMARQMDEFNDLVSKLNGDLELQLFRLGAFKPLPDFGAYLQIEQAKRAFASVNIALDKAVLLGEITLFEEETSSEIQIEEQARNKLIQIISAEALECLEEVHYAPVSLISCIRRAPKTMYSLDSREFEVFIAQLIEKLGFENVQLTPASGDKGRDILATYHVHGIPILFAFECKRYAAHRPVGVGEMRALLGSINQSSTRATKGVLVTSSCFTRGAQRLILTEPNLDGRDFQGIVTWLGKSKHNLK